MGAGPATIAGLVAHLASSFDVLAPVHPGWEGSDAVAGDPSLTSPAAISADLDRGAADGLVVGSSVGGWIAAEMATQDGGGPRIERWWAG